MLSNHIAFLQVARRSGAIVDVVPSDAAGELDIEALERMIDRARQADRHHACADQWRPGQSGGGGRAHRPRPRHPLSARRLPIRRPDADRRRHDRLRHAVRDRAEIPARAARDRVPLCAARRPRPARAAVSRFAGDDLGRARPLRDAPRRPTLRELGTQRRGTARSRRRGRLRARLGSRRHSRRASRRWPTSCGGGSRKSPVSASAIAGAGAVASSPSRSRGNRRRDIVAALRQQRINCHSSGPSSTLLGAPARRLPALVRASVHYYNTEEEVARFVAAVAALA